MKIIIASAVITVHFIIQVIGINYTSATNTGWIISVTPLVMVALSAVFLKEKITGRLVIGIVLATAGILLLVSRGAGTLPEPRVDGPMARTTDSRGSLSSLQVPAR